MNHTAPPLLERFPKTLIVDLSLQYGGSSSRVLSLMKASPKGAIALAGLSSGAVLQEAKRLGLPAHPLGRRKTDPGILPRLVRLIREHDYQILDTQNIQSKFWGSLASTLTNAALVSTIHSWYSNEHGGSSLKGNLYTRLELSTNWRLDLYITVSEKDKSSLLRSNIPENRIELIYNAVNIEAEGIPGSPEWLRKTFSLPSRARVCAAAGRLVPIKGYDVLIRAAAQTAKQAPGLVFLIVGDGKERERLDAQIRELHLEHTVHLAGYQNRETVLKILKSSDLFAMPSLYEGTPIALLEAAAFGKPIVASNSGGMPELVEHERHALLVPPGDPNALANALHDLYTNPNKAERLGKNAQARVRESFNLQTQVEKTWNAYKKALANRINSEAK